MAEKIKLYELPPSPNNIKVRIALNYKKIPFESPPLQKRRKRGKDVPDSVTFTHTVPEIF